MLHIQWTGDRFSRSKVTLQGSLGLIGFTSAVGQIILMREFLTVCQGNEISIGLILSTWLFWTALGSATLGRWVIRSAVPERWMVLLQSLIAVVLPLTLLGLRAGRNAFGLMPGELVGPELLWVISAIVLSGFCFISGGLFSLGSRILVKVADASAGTATSSLYLLEALGAGLGGLLAGFLLVPLLNPVQIVLLLGACNLVAAASILSSHHFRWVVVGSVVVASGFILVLVSPLLNSYSLGLLWHGLDLVDTRDSLYANLAVVRTQESKTLYGNGLVIMHVPSRESAEEAVHFALLQHPKPERILMIGGGLNGSVEQALQHPSIGSLEYVELDPEIFEVARLHFPEQWETLRSNSKVSVHHVDGRLYLRRSRLLYDVIIVNLPDPQTVQLNRFYTAEFFQEVAGRLEPGGLFSFSVSGAENYISEELAGFLACLQDTLKTAFDRVAVIPGNTIHFLGGPASSSLNVDPSLLIERLKRRGINNRYVREYYLPFRLMPDRLADLQLQMASVGRVRVNWDFAPIAYYLNSILWTRQFGGWYPRLISKLGQVDFGSLVLVALVASLLWPVCLMQRGEGWIVTAGCSSCILAAGFTLICLQILLLVGFQMIYGYVYHELSLILAAFMAGLAAGSWISIRGRQADRRDRLALLLIQIALASAGPGLYAVLEVMTRVTSGFWVFLIGAVCFPFLALLCGGLGGYQFPVASRIFFSDRSTARGFGLGWLYGLDLLGASFGALIISAHLLPVFGFFKSTILIGCLNVGPTAWAALGAVQGRQSTQGS